MLEPIFSNAGQPPIGPYAQAIRANGFIFCSGNAGVDPATGAVVDGVAAQTRRILLNLQAVLQAAGSDLARVAQVTVYLKQMSDYAAMNAVYAELFGAHTPARTTVAVADLAKPGALLVMDLIAVAP